MQLADANIIDGLRNAGLLGEGAPVLEPLTGGVSCDVWKVDTPSGPIVVKRPLPQLRVKAEWLAPIERGQSEVRWLKRAASINPKLVPEVLAEFPQEHAFAMRFLPDCPVWKDELVAGRVDIDLAAAVGRGIASIHAATAGQEKDEQAFDTGPLFRALRIDPFLIHVAERDAEMEPILRALADELSRAKIALVHGDVSPKNILVNDTGPVFLDAECAVYGDPAFDLAFCTTHLLLKAIWLDDDRLRQSAISLVDGYRAMIDWEDAASLMLRAGKLTAALLLARVDGKSPAPYITDPAYKAIIRGRARALLLDPVAIDQLVNGWKRTRT